MTEQTNVTTNLLDWLRQPTTYAHRPQQVEHVETHISHIFLAGEFVFKLKKPVRYDFLDFTTLAQREAACREELRLNRRLAAEIYLEVCPIAMSEQGTFNWTGDGATVDWVVCMRRLPLDQTLEALLLTQALTPEHVERLTQRLVEFYRQQVPLSITAEAYREPFEQHVQANAKVLLGASPILPQELVQRTQAFQMQLLELQRHWFHQRVADQRIYDGHGDLRPEHICFTEPIAIFDCIEFNAEFRRVDVLDELAFLAAECDFHHANWVGQQLLARYEALSGDHPPQILLDFYKAYRASVRAKVAALRAAQLVGEAAATAHQEALHHLQRADAYAQPHGQPLLILVGGLSGSGKTTLAQALAERFVAELLRTDLIRQEAAFAHDPQEKYSLENRRRVYEALFQRGEDLNAAGVSVVFDATFSAAELVTQAVSHAKQANSLVLAVECYCRDEIAQERIERRRAEGQDASQASVAVLQSQRAQWEPWPEAVPACRIDTEQPLAAQVAQVVEQLRAMLNHRSASPCG